MATDLGRVKSTAASKHDAFVASQLKQAETRIRMLDLTAGLLGFAALSLVYVVGMVLCDSKLLLSQQTRQLSLYIFVGGAAVYLFFTVLRPLWLRVNPYYAARQMEQQLPHAKNSIVNWVDLHQQPLPPAIRGALGQRAAKDLAHVDLERAISGRRAAWMGGLAGLFALVFMASFFLLGPAPFMSLLKRTFNPFETVGVSTRTRLTLLKPEGGNASVTVGRGINFAVEVGGKVPDPKAADAVKLLYRYEEGDPWLERRLVQEPSGEWTASLSAIEVKNGFWYKITGGDAATEEYRVAVRAAPAITEFLATYRFRSYVARADEVHRERELKALRGTEVLLRVRTNRALREARLELESNGRARGVSHPVTFVRGQVDADEPHTFLARFVLDKDGQYRLCFTSTDGEAYRDPVSYSVTAIPDQPPAVELTKPGQDIRLPADALLHLEGKAGDDIGVQSLVLQMRVIGGGKLRSQPYRSDEQIRLADGGYPRQLEYKEFVDLSHVKRENGQPAQLRSGMELEYWLEAFDVCDYPHANVSESKHYRVQLTDPEKNDPKKNQEKQQAENEKKQHEQKQDQKLRKENQQRQEQRQEQQARNKEEENKARNGSKGKQGAGGEKSQQKQGEQANNGENTENKGQQGQNQSGQGDANNGEQKSELSKENQSIEDRIKKALEKKGAGRSGKGESNTAKSDSGQGKGEQPNKPGGDKSKGEKKDVGQAQAGAGKSGESKDKSETAPQQGKAQSKDDTQTAANPGRDKQQPKGRDQDSSKGDSKAAQGKGQLAKGANDRKEGSKGEKKQNNAAPKSGTSTEQNKGEKSAKGENKPGVSSLPRQATPKDVADQERALQSQDAREREQAKQQLQRIAKEAADPQTRKKAAEALEKKGEPDSSAGKETPKKGSNPPGKAKGEDDKGEKNDGSKDAGSSAEKGNSKDASSGQKNGPSDKKQQGSSSREELPGPQASQNGNTPGGGGDRRSDANAHNQPSVAPQPKQPDKPRDPRAAQMQLEDFARQVNKDILKEAGVSEQAWKKYLQAKRKQLEPREKPRPEAPNTPRQASQLPSMGGKTIQPAASGSGDARGDRGQPLPGYRDSFRKFTREMSKDK
jgi:hypothetical protein